MSRLLEVVEVSETEIRAIEAELCVRRRQNRLAQALADARLQRALRPAPITSTEQHAICATTRPARIWRMPRDGPALSR